LPGQDLEQAVLVPICFEALGIAAALNRLALLEQVRCEVSQDDIVLSAISFLQVAVILAESNV